jgi:hypothetical protein
MSTNYQAHPELYLGDDENEPKPANCKCEWNERDGSYFWNPDCPEHDEPEGAYDEEWKNWFWSYREEQNDRGSRKRFRIWPLFEGVHKIENAIRYVESRARWHQITGDEAIACYAVLYRLRGEIEEQIVAIAQEI